MNKWATFIAYFTYMLFTAKYLKIGTPKIITLIVLITEQLGSQCNNITIIISQDTNETANSIDPDQTAADLGLHCLFRPVCPNI